MGDKVAVIFGFGPHVGVDVALALATQGYKIAVVSRSDKHASSAKGYLQVQADLSDPSSVGVVFSAVVKELGHPSVVVYNGMLSFDSAGTVR
jgi:NAD(P)-dependent dehydrogenase (short-subunit alcohol dehydrogenase family)